MSFIEQYIRENASSPIRSRGERIYRQKKIISCNIDKTKDVAVYSIRGTGGTYLVTIAHFEGENISSECSCPFDWGIICKHEVAALLHLDQELNNGSEEKIAEKQKRINTKRKTTEPYYIENYKSLTLQQVYLHFASGHYWGSTVSLSDFFPEERKVNFTCSDYSSNNLVSIHLHHEKGLGFQCDCGKTTAKLCPHESGVLNQLIRGDIGKFSEQLEPEFLENKKKETLKEFGLPEDTNFQDYFSLKFSVGGALVHPAEKGLGLQRIKKYRSNSETGILSQVNELTKKELLNLPLGAAALPKEKIEIRKIGYVLVAGGIKGEIVHPELVPISGKPSKDGSTIATHIKTLNKLDGYEFIQLTEEDKTLISLAGNLSKENTDRHLGAIGLAYGQREERLQESQKFFLEKLKQIVPLLEKQPYVYLYTQYQNISDSYINIRKSDFREIKVSVVPPELSFRLHEKDELVILRAKYRLGEHEIEIEPRDPALGYPFLFTKIKNTYHLNNSLEDSYWLSVFGEAPVIKVVRSEFEIFFEDMIKPIAKKFPVKMEKISGITKAEKKLLPEEKQLYLSEVGNCVLFKPMVAYSEEGAKEKRHLADVLHDSPLMEKLGETITNYERDIPYEQEFISFLKTMHPRFENQLRTDLMYLPAEEMLNGNWFFNAFEKLKEEKVSVFGYNELKSFNYSPHKAKISVQLSSGEDWFDLQVSVAFGDMQVSLKEVQKAVLRNEQYVKLSDGTTGILPEEWFEKFKKYFRHGEVSEDEIKISKLKFSIIDELFEKIDDQEILRELAEKKQKLILFKEIKSAEIPKGITAQLRGYQKEGFNWLNFLQEFQWGGILADDMGLGKTLQALAFLMKASGESEKANLIVMPTSLMFNWENEIKKFAHSLKVLFYHGSDREKDHTLFKKFNLVLTTYGLMARDIEIFGKYKFHYVILDESQAIKNPLSQRFKAACLLRADRRIALTGTPIENNTFDLFAQMSFVNPGFLGNANSFKEQFSTPIDTHRNKERAAELQKLISPFVLRRTKEQVEKDLPEKTEDIIYCEMEKEQRKVYDAFRNKYRNYIIGKIEEGGIAKSKIYVLEGLLKLRQICDSPEILSDDEKYTNESVKVEELLRHINEKTGKHKILVFSQFVKMLHVIQGRLDKSGIVYEYLDGKNTVEQRQQSVHRFQSDESCRVFLISLKAGGMGINLTAADYVYIVDPWWNPAVENQAIDRCHRIGQDKKVIAYRMICKNTVEEKILNLQAKKKQIAADIIQTDESIMKSLTRNDIEHLFE